MYKDIAMILDKFPRQYCNPKRRDVKNLQELLIAVNIDNGKKRCFTTVYNYSYNNRMPTIDRAFFDIDLEDYASGEHCFQAAKSVFEYLEQKEWKFYSQFSGGGFHFIVFTQPMLDGEYLRSFMMGVSKDLTGVEFDTTSFGDIARIYPVLYTINVRRGKYVTPLSKDDFKLSYEIISERANQQTGKLHIYGKNLASNNGGVHLSNRVFEEGEMFNKMKVEIDNDVFLQELPPCIAFLLKKGDIKYHERGTVLSYLIPRFVNRDIIKQILKKYLTEDKYMHCVMPTNVYHKGKPCENQLEYMFRKFESGNWFAQSCSSIRSKGMCPMQEGKCKNDLYGKVLKV